MTADLPPAEIIAWLDSEEGQQWQERTYGTQGDWHWTRNALAWILPGRLFSTGDYEPMSGPLNPEYDPAGRPA
jgi:hypothetical protein